MWTEHCWDDVTQQYKAEKNVFRRMNEAKKERYLSHWWNKCFFISYFWPNIQLKFICNPTIETKNKRLLNVIFYLVLFDFSVFLFCFAPKNLFLFCVPCHSYHEFISHRYGPNAIINHHVHHFFFSLEFPIHCFGHNDIIRIDKLFFRFGLL